jgi:mRNA-degrading endonuclease HigB of HigAB toxin-antitoxin module
MLREAKELFKRYDEAYFHEEDNLDAFQNFCERMAYKSPEVIDVESPYLN